MMRTILLATAAVLIASPALATGNGPPNNVPPPFQDAGAATANAAAAASATASAKAVQAQRQSTNVDVRNVARGGNAQATGGEGGAGGNATSGPVGVNVDASSNDRSYAMGLGGYAAASGPCIGVSTSAGVGILGWMFQGGRTEIEDECQIREAARIAASVGMPDLARDLIRSLPSVRKALASLEPPAPAATAVSITRTAQARVERPECNAPWVGGVMLPQPAGC